MIAKIIDLLRKGYACIIEKDIGIFHEIESQYFANSLYYP